MIDDALGDLAGDVEIAWSSTDVATTSPTDTPLWHALERVARRSYPDARCVPFLTVGATDARFYRRMGAIAYGFGLFSENLSFEQYASMFHGVDERVDVASLGLSAQLWDGLVRESLR
jgi:acetylornithine deacetylase/succinyl-diaminopimelate desuccinylase-like protein